MDDRPITAEDPLEWMIRNAAGLDKAEGAAAEVMREYYRMGLEGLRFAPPGRYLWQDMPANLLSSLSALAVQAYRLGIQDAEGRDKDGHNKCGGRRHYPFVGGGIDLSDTLAARPSE